MSTRRERVGRWAGGGGGTCEGLGSPTGRGQLPDRPEKDAARPCRGPACSSRIFLATKSLSTSSESLPANVPASCCQRLGTEGQRRQSLCPPPAEAGVPERLGVTSLLTSGFSSIFLTALSSVTCPGIARSPHTTVPTAAASALVRGVASAELHLPPPPALTGVPVSTSRVARSWHRDPHHPPAPHWPSPPCGQPGPAGITQLPSLPRALDYLQLTRAFTPMSSRNHPHPPWEPSGAGAIAPILQMETLRLNALPGEFPKAWPPDSLV